MMDSFCSVFGQQIILVFQALGLASSPRSQSNGASFHYIQSELFGALGDFVV